MSQSQGQFWDNFVSLPSRFLPSSLLPDPSSSSLSGRLCSVCQAAIQGRHTSWIRRLDNFFVSHHWTISSLLVSVHQGCHVCSVFWRNIPKEQQDALASARTWFYPPATTLMFIETEKIEAAMSDGVGPHITEFLGPHLLTLCGPNTVMMVMGLARTVGQWLGSTVKIPQGVFQLAPAEELEHYCLSSHAANTTRSEESWSVAMKWYQDCTANHSKCKEARSDKDWFPSRLIDIGLSENCEPRLLITRDEAPDGLYVTLSHRWGLAGFIQLTCDSLHGFTQRIPMSDLPKTFVHAIYVTRRLGFRYIWIDSLCIIQDSPGGEDWLREAMLMHLVYSNSMCNIAATGATENSQGLFKQRPVHSLYPCEIVTAWRGIESPVRYHVLDLGFLDAHLNNAPLNRRGWVVQERFLAPRVLHFGEQQLLWECREFDAAERYPTGLPRFVGPGGFKLLDDRPRMLPLSRERDESNGFGILWSKIVKAYSKSQLTVPDDKLIALAGVAKMLQSTRKDEYIAGMWKEFFASQLVWRVDQGRQSNGKPSVRPTAYRAPSFSWLSVDGVITPPVWKKQEILVEIVEINIVPLTSDNTGRIKEGYIRIRGRLKPLTLQRYNHINWRMIVNGVPVLGKGKDLWNKTGPMVHMDINQDEIYGELYCMRIIKHENGGFLCGLILEPTGVERGQFRRLGVFETPPDPDIFKILQRKVKNADMMPCESYDPISRKHTITII